MNSPRKFRFARLALAAMFVAVAVSAAVRSGGDWQSASHESAGLAPPVSRTPGAVVQVYAALDGSHGFYTPLAAPQWRSAARLAGASVHIIGRRVHCKRCTLPPSAS